MGSALAASGGAAMNDGDLRLGVTGVPRAVGAVFAIGPSPAPCPIGYCEQGAEGYGANRADRASYRRLPTSGSER